MNTPSFSSRANNLITEAVMFFDENGIAKEMLYGEFEAVLDNVVGISDFAGQEVRAAFLLIDGKLSIQAACFFLIKFEADGSADPNWNIPLRHLVDQASKGPDMGGGAIRLVCRSQCPISWHERDLWDPVVRDDLNYFHQIKIAAKENRLGLLEQREPLTTVVEENVSNSARAFVSDDVVRDTLVRQFRQEYKRRIASLKEEFRLQLAALKTQHEEQLKDIRHSHQAALTESQEGLQSIKALLKDEKRRTLLLQSQLLDQLSAVEALRNEVVNQSNVGNDALEALRHQYEVELSARVDQSTQELKEHLERREVELFYRDEQINTLGDEIVRVRQERDALIGGSGDQLIKQMTSAGITFVAYHPGLDYLTVHPADIPGYLESPYAFVAERCGVSEEAYQKWLDHYQLPVCNHVDSEKQRCGFPVVKVSRPSHFVAEESDRCSRHSPHSDVILSVMKFRR